MQFTVGNEAFRIVFRYDSQPNSRPHSRDKNQETTTASIREPGQGGKTIASAMVVRHFKDSQNYDQARKAALRKLLASMAVPKAFRTAAWAGYHSRPGGIKAKA